MCPPKCGCARSADIPASQYGQANETVCGLMDRFRARRRDLPSAGRDDLRRDRQMNWHPFEAAATQAGAINLGPFRM